MLNEEKRIDYKNLDLLFNEAKRLLNEKSLSRTEIANLITDNNPKKQPLVYNLLGEVFRKYSGFECKGRKYSLKL